MPLISDDSITINSIPMTDYASTAAPATPASGKSRIFTRADGLYYMDDAGAETGPMGEAGLSNPMTTAGDIIIGGASGTPTRLGIGTALQVLRTNAGATAPEWATPAGIDYILLRHDATQNTAGGSFTTGDWRTRPVTTELVDTGNHCSISSNQITLAAGTYRYNVVAMIYNVQNNQMRLQNITDASTTDLGPSNSLATGQPGSNFLKGSFTIAAQKTFEIQHRGTATQNTNGFGIPANWTTEVYLIAEFWKVV